MKGIKGRFLRRFRSIPSSYTSKHHVLVPLCNKSQDKFCDQNPQNLPNHIHQELIRTMTSLDLREEEEELESRLYHIKSDDLAQESDIFEDCDSGFDSMPEMESSSSSSSSSSPISNHCESNDDGVHTNFRILESPEDQLTENLLDQFEEKCPPGGRNKVILYTTSLRGIRKTYEDCHAIKFLLESLRVVYFERDVSMHLEFRDELWGILGGRVIPPRLFIKGKHIGGADEVITLNEVGNLKKLLQGMPVVGSAFSNKCSWCAGVRFLLCPDCNGSCRTYKGVQPNGGISLFVRCPKCNENGLVKCPICT